MNNLVAFWSYVHDDDKAEKGRISQLCKDITDQYGLISAEIISIFHDINDIKWGDDWRNKIESNLTSVVFFIPIITPRYLASTSCRTELQYFTHRATSLGIRELILPILYIDFPELHDKSTEDDLIKLINSFQWEDWTEIRFLDVSSEGYRRRVSQLAKRLIEANKRIEEGARVEKPVNALIPVDNVEEPPGFIDLIASAEEYLPKCTAIIEEIAEGVISIGDLMKKATDDITRSNNQGVGFSARLSISKRLSKELLEPVNTVYKLCNEYATYLHEVDQGFRIMINQASKTILENPDVKQNVFDFFNSIHIVDMNSSEAFEKTQSLIQATEQGENISRDLRPVFRKLKQGLIIFNESREVISSWTKLIVASGIEYPHPEEGLK